MFQLDSVLVVGLETRVDLDLDVLVLDLDLDLAFSDSESDLPFSLDEICVCFYGIFG